MNNNDALRKANKIQYKMARRFLAQARTTDSVSVRAGLLSYVKTCRQLIARNRASIV